MPLEPGATVGPYKILSKIGEGGMGAVYKARDPRLDRMVAIKTVNAQFAERFQREAKAIAALNHPHICQLYDVGDDYLVMEFVDGKPVRGPLPLDDVLRLGKQIASGLAAAHGKNVIHRDLKPGNILVAKSGVKILDFGLAKVTKSEMDTLTVPGEVMGTYAYMAPEQFAAEETDERTDIWAMGAVLYEMSTGERAFKRDATQTLNPPMLNRIVSKCLNKDTDERWQSAQDVREALEFVTLAVPGRKASKPMAVDRRNGSARGRRDRIGGHAPQRAAARLACRIPHSAAGRRPPNHQYSGFAGREEPGIPHSRIKPGLHPAARCGDGSAVARHRRDGTAGVVAQQPRAAAGHEQEAASHRRCRRIAARGH